MNVGDAINCLPVDAQSWLFRTLKSRDAVRQVKTQIQFPAATNRERMMSQPPALSPAVAASSAADADGVAYLAAHGVPALMNTLAKELFQDKPADVVGYLLESLRRKRAARDAALL